MTDKEIQRVVELDKADCRILIQSRYVDSFAHVTGFARINPLARIFDRLQGFSVPLAGTMASAVE